MPLEIEAKKSGDVAVLYLRGKITLGEASQGLRKAVTDQVAAGTANIVLNLAGVPFIDSAGLGTLTVGFTAARNAGGALKIAEAQSRVRDALEVTRLTRMFQLFASEREAVESFGVLTAPDSGSPAQ